MKNIVFITVLVSSFAFGMSFEEEAKSFLKPVKMAFMGELKEGLKEGPYNAIDSCHIKAPHLIEHDKSDKFEMGRTSNKIRNPQNKPKKWMLPILAEYEKSNAEKPMPGKVYDVTGKKVYVDPIYLKPVCMNCHGKTRGSVGKRIKKLYPKDQAVGYQTGDFRGLFWVKQK